MKTDGLLKIIIIILLVAIVPGGLIIALLAASIVAIQQAIIPIILTFLGVGILLVIVRAKSQKISRQNGAGTYESEITSKIPPMLQEMGFDPQLTLDYFDAYLKECNRKYKSHSSLFKPYFDATLLSEVAWANPQFKFAVEDKYYLQLYDAVFEAKEKIEKREQDLINDKARQLLPDDLKIAVDYFRACQEIKVLAFNHDERDNATLSAIESLSVNDFIGWINGVVISSEYKLKKVLEIATKDARFYSLINEDNYSLMLATGAKAVCDINKQSGHKALQYI